MLVSHKNFARSDLLNRDLSVLMEAHDRFSGAIAKRTGFNSLCASVPSMVRSRMPRRERRFAGLAHLPVRAHRMILSEGTLVEISGACEKSRVEVPYSAKLVNTVRQLNLMRENSPIQGEIRHAA